MDFNIHTYKRARPEAGPISTQSSPSGVWHDGHVYTVHGIVRVYSQSGKDAFSSFGMVIGGRACGGSVKRYARPRRLVTLAARFAEECAALNDPCGEGATP